MKLSNIFLFIGAAAASYKLVENRQKIQEETNMTILFISHNQSLIESFCSNVIVLNEGRLIEKIDLVEKK